MSIALNVTVTPPVGPASGAPLLFVHGAWHTAWCWHKFTEYFSQRGHECRALDLRGHGLSGNDRSLKVTRLDGYVEDVRQTVAAIRQETGTPPVLVGHSMGGLVVQKYLETDHAIPKAVLLASVPIHGAWQATLRFAARHPIDFLVANVTWSLVHMADNHDAAGWAFYSHNVDESDLREHLLNVQDESYLAFLDMMFFRLPRPSRVTTPLLVLGGADDSLFKPAEIEATARAYGAECHIFPKTPHNMMQGRTWHDVADAIEAWLPPSDG